LAIGDLQYGILNVQFGISAQLRNLSLSADKAGIEYCLLSLSADKAGIEHF
jgi:hypothetical protein